MGPENGSSDGQEVTAPDGTRIVGDDDGNEAVWNPETGEVTIARVTDPEAHDDTSFDFSDADLES
jgi:hypothetical protein